MRFFLPLLLSIRPPLLSIRPPLLPVFDAGLVADAGGEKRASRRGYQIEQIQEARKSLEKLLTLLQSAPVERDRFVSHLYQSRRAYRRACETAGKSGKQIERCVIASFQIADSMGFKGEFRQWEDVLRVGE